MPQGERLKVKGSSNCVGERVRLLRDGLKLTQDALCARIAHETGGWADPGTRWVPTKTEISRIESGIRAVLDLEVLALAKVLGVTPKDLLPASTDDL